MSDHELIITIEQGWSTSKVHCTADQDAECRNLSRCNCEAYENIQRDDQGWFHTVGCEEDDDFETHRHYPSDECNLCNWINADDPMECIAPGISFDVPAIPIETSWAGDFYEWKPLKTNQT